MANGMIDTDGDREDGEVQAGHSGPDRDDLAPDIAPLQELRGYWDGLRSDNRIPERAEIDPRGIAGALENAFLIEMVSPQLARLRLCGMHLHDLMTMDPTGMPLSALFAPSGRDRLGRALQQVFENPAVLDIALEATRGAGRPALSGRLMVMPLRDREGAVTMALGGLVTAGEIGNRPRQFAIATLMTEALARPEGLPLRPTYAEPASEPARPAARGSLRLLEFGEPMEPFLPAPRRGSDAPYLRLVHSSD